MRTPKNNLNKSSSKGFALVATILITSMLMLLALSMMSMSSIETRSAKTGQDQLIAEANARMALMIALAELQESAGPDQRITANSSILDKDIKQPHVLGVWKSIGDGIENTHDLSKIATAYKSSYSDKQRDKRFLRWMISGGKNTAEIFEYPQNEPTDNVVQLIGPHTLGIKEGSALSAEEQKKLLLAPLVKTTNKNQSSGAYAWAVSGENLKARVNFDPISQDNKLAHRTSSPQNAIHAINGNTTGSPSLTDFIMDKNGSMSPKLDKVSSWSSLSLGGYKSASEIKDDLKFYYHDLSTSSYGLLANAKSGGLQKDLSLLSEREILPESMVLSDKSTAQIYADGPYWGDLTAHMRSYKSFDDGGLVEWRNDIPFYTVGPTWAQATRRRGWQHRMPVVSKWLWVLSYFGERVDAKNSKMNMVVQPVIELWNPYNLPMLMPEDSAYELKFFSMPLALNVNQTGKGQVITNRGIHFPVRENEEINDPSTPSVATVNYKVKFQNKKGAKIALQPGEVVLFSDGSDTPQLPSSNVITLTKGLQIRGGTYSRNLDHYGKQLILPNTASVEVHYQPRNEWFYSDNYFTGPSSYPTQWSYQSEIVTKSSMNSTSSLFSPSGERFSIGSTPIESPQPSLIIGSVLRTEHPIADPDKPEELTLSEKTRFSPYLYSPITMGQSYVRDNNSYQLETNPYFFFARRVTDFDDVHVSIEDSNGHLGRSHDAEGQTHVTIREIPIQPLTSIAQLQHAGLGHYSIKSAFNPQTQGEISDLRDTQDTTKLKPWHLRSHPHVNYAFGNSFSSPFTNQDTIEKEGISPLSGQFGGESGYAATLHDKSWKLNESLWDTWFVSGIGNWDNPLISDKQTKQEMITSFITEGKKLPNERYESIRSDSGQPSETAKKLGEKEGYKTVAAHMMNRGSFNVNSTSVYAWKAVLGGLDMRVHSFPFMNATDLKWETDASAEGYPISRFTLPNGEMAESNGGGIAFWNKRWLGSRKITDEELTKLAQAVVDEVQLRGPFLSMSEFINRRLSDDEMGQQGALQAAIKRSGINASFNSDSDLIDELKGEYSNQESIKQKETGRGAPGYITQADLLMPIAPSLTVRCDTFTIRAYGEAHDSSGKVTARAWCQAVVQRIPRYVDSTNAADTQILNSEGMVIDDALSDTNRKFGREFMINSFQWLSENEI